MKLVSVLLILCNCTTCWPSDSEIPPTGRVLSITRVIVCVTMTRTPEQGRLTWGAKPQMSFVSFHLSSFLFLRFIFLPYFLFPFFTSWTNLRGPVAPEPPSWSPGFKSRSQDWISWNVFMMFLRIVLEIGHDRVLPHLFQFIIQHSTWSALLTVSWRKT
jgi:hypothetical protein